MRIDIMTLFPDMCNAVLSESIIGRARQAGKVEINCVDIRNYTLDKHRRVDDKPYGGGMGMIMAPQRYMIAIRQFARIWRQASFDLSYSAGQNTYSAKS